MKTSTLKNKNFVIILIGQIISLFGNGILRFALPLYLLTLTGSPGLFGAVSALSFIPMIFLMPLGGIIADRVNKGKIMVVLDFVTAGVMGMYYLTMNTLPLVPLLVATLMVLYSISSLYQPAVSASMPAIFEEEALPLGNGMVSSVSALSNLISPILGGILFGAFGIVPIVTISIICFIVSAVLELFLNIPHEKNNHGKKMFAIVKSDIQESIRFILKEKPIVAKLIFTTFLINSLISSLVIISSPVFIVEILKLSENMYGISQGIMALGGILGGLAIGIFEKKLKNISTRFFLLSLTLIPLAFSLATNKTTAFVLITLSGFLTMIVATVLSIEILTFVQNQTKKELQGKVIALLMTFSMCGVPLGQLVYGMAFEYFIGFEWAIVTLSIILCILIGLYAKKVLKKE